MNKFTIAFLILFLLSTTLIAQRSEAILIFKDGSRITGLGDLTNAQTIKFRKAKREKRQIFTFQEVDTLKIIQQSKTVVYVQVPIKDRGEPEVLEVLSQTGGIVHYQKAAYTGNISGRIVIRNYLRKIGENETVYFGSDNLVTKNFKKVASEFFNDCKELVQLIQNDQFDRRDLKNIIAYYNEECN